MIEFNGYLTGASEKFFFKKYVTYMQNAFIFGLVMGIAFDFYADENFSNIFNILRILCGFCICHDSGSH